MVAIHVITDENRSDYVAVLDEHHRIRRDIYIREKGWRALSDVDGREVDQFDGPGTTYLLGLDDNGSVVCGSRLHPSLEPTLLSSVFPQLANIHGIERSTDVYEWTRVFVVPGKREGHRSTPLMGVITCALLEHCRCQGVRSVNVVTETFWIPRFMGLGWKLRLLGEEIEHDGLHICAFNFPIDETVVEQTRSFYGLPWPVLTRRREAERSRQPTHEQPKYRMAAG